jgi:TPR repeat protein
MRMLAQRIILSLAFTVVPIFAQDPAPVIVLKAADRVPWSNLKELQSYAARGNLKACAQLGEQLLRGDGLPQDVPRALSLLEQAARGGVASAAFRLGMLLEDGDNVAKDETRALAYLRAAAAGGAAEAFRNIGVAYSTGRGVKRDYAEALAWLILAKKKGTAGTVDDELRSHIRSLRHPEWISAGEQRAPELERELAQGVVKFLPPPAPFVPASSPTSAQSSNPTAASTPERATPAPGSAVEKPAIEKLPTPSPTLPALAPPTMPELPAMRSLADDIADHTPVKVGLPTGRALSWPNLAGLQATADSGNADALAAFGQIHLTGQQVSTNPTRAISYLERGAKAGSADAAALLADLYTKGLQAPRDETKAFTYTLQAAKGGVRTALHNLGALYANGSGTKSDYTESLAWLLVAQHFNLDSGQLSRIRDYLTKTDAKQIPIAERRAAERVKEIEAARATLGL